MPFVRSDSADIYWKVEGEAANPPLVLLNSIGADMDLWDLALPALRKRFSLLRIDARGHGASSAPEGDYSLEQLADDVSAAMDAAGMASAAVAGVSLGGMVAMQLALAMPGRVTALALICTSATMDNAAWAARVVKVRAEGMDGIADLAMARFLSPEFSAEDPGAAASIRRGLTGMASTAYAGCGAAIRDMRIADRLGALAVPALVVTGTRDISTPLDDHGEYLLSHIRRAQHVALEAAHLAPVEAPQALAAALIGFLLR